MKVPELKELCQILNPDKVEGRLILITRYGATKIESMLPAHIKAVQESGVPVVWQCDGVHGNTVTASNKLKTRKFDDIVGEEYVCVYEQPLARAREHRVERQCARVEDPRRERERDDDEPRGPH